MRLCSYRMTASRFHHFWERNSERECISATDSYKVLASKSYWPGNLKHRRTVRKKTIKKCFLTYGACYNVMIMNTLWNTWTKQINIIITSNTCLFLCREHLKFTLLASLKCAIQGYQLYSPCCATGLKKINLLLQSKWDFEYFEHYPPIAAGCGNHHSTLCSC